MAAVAASLDALLFDQLSLAASEATAAPAHGLLLTGPSGVGKSTLVSKWIEEHGHRAVWLRSEAVFGGLAGESERYVLSQLSSLQKAGCSSSSSGLGKPCSRKVVVLDGAETLLAASRAGASTSALTERIKSLLFELLDRSLDQADRPSPTPVCSQCAQPLLWLAITSSPELLDMKARYPGRFHKVLELPLPTLGTRQAFLKQLMPPSFPAELLSVAASRTHAFSLADLQALARSTIKEQMRRESKGEPTAAAAAMASASAPSAWVSSLETALQQARPSALLQAVGTSLHGRGSTHAADASFLGCSEVLQAVRDALLLPLKHASLLQQMGVSCPSGLLLHGPAGTGKTLLALQIAKEAQAAGLAHALLLRGPDVVSAEVGSSERALSLAFHRARQLAPCIIIVDHFECLAPRRTLGAAGAGGEDGGEASGSAVSAQSRDRLLSLLLTELDGLSGGQQKRAVGGKLSTSTPTTLLVEPDSLSASVGAGGRGSGSSSSKSSAGAGGILLVAITRSPADLDEAILRPGRLDTHVSTRLPTRQEVQLQLQALMQRMEPGQRGRLQQEALLTQLCGPEGCLLGIGAKTPTQAEVEGAWQAAVYDLLQQDMHVLLKEERRGGGCASEK